jgi:serine/threonine protein kinase
MPDSSPPAVPQVPNVGSSLVVGATISGRYKVEKMLGEGGMGAVYLVQHTAMRKRFALKVLNSQTAQMPEMVARFEREAMAAAHVEHPNITVAVDFGKTDDGALYLVLEYLEGHRLRDALAGGPLDIPRALHIARQIASALERSHELGIVHRDLKPENIMLVSRQGDRDFVKVLDFGLAKVAEVEPGTDAPAQALTKVGTIFGTPKYMAPEQCVGGPVDGRADLYALGLILFEMLTGVQAFSGKDALRTITLQLTAPTPSMKSVAPGVTIPASLEAVVKRLTEKQPESRYGSATEVLTTLAQLAEKEGILSPATSVGAISPLGLRTPAASDSSGGVKTIHSVQMLSEVQQSPPAKTTLTSKDAESPRTVASIDVMEVPVQPVAPLPRELPSPTEKPSIPTEKPSAPIDSPVGPNQEGKSLLRLLTERLPAPLQNVPPPILLAAPALLIAIVLFLVLRSGTTDTATQADQKSVPAMATQAQIEQASSGGVAALSALTEQYPQDPRIRRALAQALMAQNNGLDALRWMAKAVAIDSSIVSEAEARQAAELALNAAESTETALPLLESELGTVGVDVLYALATRPGQSRVKVARISQSLAKPEVRAHASAAALIALDLRAAEKCEAKHALLQKAAELGDLRALEQLKPLLLTRNCGPMGLLDCWPCLRKDAALRTAIAAIAARTKAGK